MKKMTVMFLLFCLCIVACPVTTIHAQEKEQHETTAWCSPDETINMDQIIGIEVIDGNFYIDVLSELDSDQPMPRYQIGRCPHSYKVIKKSASRAKLVSSENALDTSAKSNFTITSKCKCEEGNLGSRGIVYRYRLINVKMR